MPVRRPLGADLPASEEVADFLLRMPRLIAASMAALAVTVPLLVGPPTAASTWRTVHHDVVVNVVKKVALRLQELLPPSNTGVRAWADAAAPNNGPTHMLLGGATGWGALSLATWLMASEIKDWLRRDRQSLGHVAAHVIRQLREGVDPAAAAPRPEASAVALGVRQYTAWRKTAWVKYITKAYRYTLQLRFLAWAPIPAPLSRFITLESVLTYVAPLVSDAFLARWFGSWAPDIVKGVYVLWTAKNVLSVAEALAKPHAVSQLTVRAAAAEPTAQLLQLRYHADYTFPSPPLIAGVHYPGARAGKRADHAGPSVDAVRRRGAGEANWTRVLIWSIVDALSRRRPEPMLRLEVVYNAAQMPPSMTSVAPTLYSTPYGRVPREQLMIMGRAMRHAANLDADADLEAGTDFFFRLQEALVGGGSGDVTFQDDASRLVIRRQWWQEQLVTAEVAQVEALHRRMLEQRVRPPSEPSIVVLERRAAVDTGGPDRARDLTRAVAGYALPALALFHGWFVVVPNTAAALELGAAPWPLADPDDPDDDDEDDDDDAYRWPGLTALGYAIGARDTRLHLFMPALPSFSIAPPQ